MFQLLPPPPLTHSVCGIIVPWNYPLMMVAWKVGACLAAGIKIFITTKFFHVCSFFQWSVAMVTMVAMVDVKSVQNLLTVA